jgi:hypothetical protein
MRVAVELTFVRDCAECRAAADSLSTAAIHDHSVTSIRLIPGSKHAHAVKDGSGVQQYVGKPSDASTGMPEGQKQLFTPVPQSDTNGFLDHETGAV